VAGKDRNFWKYVAPRFKYIIQIQIDLGKLREVIEYKTVLMKYLLQFLKILFQLIKICPQRQ
jgi:hypothetical protein